MANFRFTILEIIQTMEIMQLRWLQIKIATSNIYANC